MTEKLEKKLGAVDFYGTAARKENVDSAYEAATGLAKDHPDFYKEGGKVFAKKIWEKDPEYIAKARRILNPEFDEVYNTHLETGRKSVFYTSGHKEGIEAIAKTRGMAIDVLTPADIGDKKEPESYKRLCDKFGVSPKNVTWMTDSKDEAEAAEQAGIGYVQKVNPPSPSYSATIDYCRQQ